MTKTIDIPLNETGMIRVFAINLPPHDVSDRLEKLPKPDLARQLLDNPHLNTSSTEIFPVSDLTGMGVAGYLTQGYAVEESQISPDRRKMEALEGYLLLLFSDSFAGAAATLAPGKDLTLIGTYSETKPSKDRVMLATDSAKPYSGSPTVTPPAPAPGPARSAMMLFALIVLLGGVLWWALG